MRPGILSTALFPAETGLFAYWHRRGTRKMGRLRSGADSLGLVAGMALGWACLRSGQRLGALVRADVADAVRRFS
jgi:hypothetical protein